MLATLIKKEIQQNLYGFKFQAIMLLTVILVFSSVYLMYMDYSQRTRSYEYLLPDLESSSSMLKPTPLAIFSKGMDEAMCAKYVMFEVSGIQAPWFVENKDISNPVIHLFPAPDLYYVTWIVLSLCAILFSFNLVIAEKEDGTLRQILATSLDRSKLVAGKWIGGFICLVLPFCLTFLVSLTTVSLAPNVQFTPQDYLRLGLFLGGSLLYLAFFFSLGMLVSTLCRRSAVALSLSLMLWAGLVFVLPGVVNAAAEKIVAMPSAQKFSLLSEQAGSTRFRAWDASRWERKNFDLKSDDLNRNPVIVDYRLRLGRLASLSQVLNRLSPVGAYSILARDLAGTGIQERLNFKRSYLIYWDSFLDFPRDGEGDLKPGYPAFTYRHLSLAHVLVHGGLLDLTLMLLETLLVFAASYVLFLRYDAR